MRKVPENYVKYCIIKEDTETLKKYRAACENLSRCLTERLLRKYSGLGDESIKLFLDNVKVVGCPSNYTIENFYPILSDIRNEVIKEMSLENYKIDGVSHYVFLSVGYEVNCSRGLDENELRRLIREDTSGTVRGYFKDFIRYRIQLVTNAYKHPIFSGADLPNELYVGEEVDNNFLSRSSAKIGWKKLKKISPELYNKAKIYCEGGNK